MEVSVCIHTYVIVCVILHPYLGIKEMNYNTCNVENLFLPLYRYSRCWSGSYQDELCQSSCKDCEAAYFCDNTLDPVVLYNNSACPTGNILLILMVCLGRKKQ